MGNSIDRPPGFDYQPQSLSGRAAVVTGGTTGIGRATALLLASQGVRVLIFGRHRPELEDALRDIGRAGEVHGLTADASSYEEVRRVFQEADAKLGGVDFLINNAAVGAGGLLDGEYEEWRYVIATDLLGYMACAREAVDRMKTRGGGHIINVGSMSAEVRGGGSTVYVAAKSGINGFSEALRKEVNRLGIRVTLIEPGLVGTDMVSVSPEDQRRQENELKMLRAEDIAECAYYCLTLPKRCDVVSVQIRPHLQEI